MIKDLRFVERSIPAPEVGKDIYRTVKISQMRVQTDVETIDWVDVPLEFR